MHSLKLSAMGVSYRLALLVLVSIVSLVAVGIGGWLGISRVSDSVVALEEARLPAASSLGEIRSSTATLLQYSFEVLSREKQANAQSQFAKVNSRKRLVSSNLDQAMDVYEKLPKSPEEAEAWTKFKESMQLWKERNKELNEIIQSLSENEDFEKQAQLFSQYKVPLASWGHVQASVDVNLTKLLSLNHAEVEKAKVRDAATHRLAMRFIFISLGVAAALLLILAVIVVRSITGPLGRLRYTIVSVANSSDFTQRAEVTGKDEMGQTAQAFNSLLSHVQGSLREVLENAENISAAAQRTADASQQVADSSGNQSEAAATMAAAIEEMTVSISHINESMHDALNRANAADLAADSGVTIMASSNREIDTIAETVEHANVAIARLSAESGRITQILQVIKDVASQTNLLALNAAIEAARAGEQGRGFAVVADEVRKLAERTTHSTTEIAALVESMQSSSQEAVNGMGMVSTQVTSGKTLSNSAVEQINGIRGNAMQVVTAINDISAAISEQSLAAQNIAREVESVARLTESGNVTAHETAKVSHDLDILAENLRQAVHRFKV